VKQNPGKGRREEKGEREGGRKDRWVSWPRRRKQWDPTSRIWCRIFAEQHPRKVQDIGRKEE
jgi:hypothetical protein